MPSVTQSIISAVKNCAATITPATRVDVFGFNIPMGEMANLTTTVDGLRVQVEAFVGPCGMLWYYEMRNGEPFLTKKVVYREEALRDLTAYEEGDLI